MRRLKWREAVKLSAERGWLTTEDGRPKQVYKDISEQPKAADDDDQEWTTVADLTKDTIWSSDD